MNIAIIGCGFIAELHARIIRELGHTLAWVIDRDVTHAQDFADRFHAGRFSTQFADALNADIEVIHICTPPALHFEMAQAALLAGKHVICEKPLCPDAQDAWTLHALALQAGRVCAVNFNVRFYEACQQARTRIAAPDFGNIFLIHGHYVQEFHILPQPYSWRYQPALAGSMRAVTEIGSHWIDLVRYWTGLEISSVSANFTTFAQDRYLQDGVMYAHAQAGAQPLRVDSEDAAAITFRFSNNALGSLLLSEVSPGRVNDLALEVTGSQQALWWQSEDPYRLFSGQKNRGVHTQTFAFGGGFSEIFRSFFEAVYRDIQFRESTPASNKQPDYPTSYDGWVNSLVCNAIYTSATRQGAWVDVGTLPK